MAGKALNKNNSAVKRIMQEARELSNDPSTDYHAAPLEDDIFEWHCTLRGPEGTEFEGGLYHFRILLPAEYPFRPPSIMMLTPNGRFELNTKICISFTNYHEELWQPAWGVRTAIIGLQGFFPLKGQLAAGVGSIESQSSERKRLAALSKDWVCPHCKVTNQQILPDPRPDSAASTSHNETLSPTPQTSVSESEKDAESRSPETENAPLQIAEVEKREMSQNETARTAALVPLSVRGVETTVLSTPLSPPPSAPGMRRSQKPPVLLDTAILVLLVTVFVIICRRMV